MKPFADISFEEVWPRIQAATGWKKDADLRRFLVISSGSMTQAKKRGRMPIEWLFEIYQEYRVSIDWLLSGRGPMYEKDRIKSEAPTAAHADDYTYIPLYDLKAAAGTGEVVYQEDVRDFLCFKTQWIKTNLRGAPKDLFLLHVKGDSMEPTLRSGDIVLVDGSITNPQEEGIYLVRLDSAIMVKRVQILEGNRIEMTSDNERYKPIAVDTRGRADLAVIGRVVWYGRKIV